MGHPKLVAVKVDELVVVLSRLWPFDAVAFFFILLVTRDIGNEFLIIKVFHVLDDLHLSGDGPHSGL